MNPRDKVLRFAADKISGLDLTHPVRVGIDGVSASGKTFFADELAEVLRSFGHKVIRAGLDGFHNPPEIRHRRGSMSVEGYVEDSFNYSAVQDCVLIPLGPGGNLRIREQVYNHKIDAIQENKWANIEPDSILVFEGVMLFRDELSDYFDFKILLETSHSVSLERAKIRDLAHFGDLKTLESKYCQRFLPGQDLYIKQCMPDRLADLIVDNQDWNAPVIKKIRI